MKIHLTNIMILLFISKTTLAGTMSSDECWGSTEGCLRPPAIEYPIQKVISLDFGPAWSNNGKTQNIYVQSGVQKAYVSSFTGNILPYGDIFLGLQKQLSQSFFAQFGIEAGGGGEAKLRGEIWEDADPNFNNYTYTYGVNEARVMAKGKLLMDVGYYVTRPFISAAVGVGFNNSHAFSIVPNIYEEVPPPVFEANINTVLTYAFGAGIQALLSEQWQIGVGYEFSNWGKSQLEPADYQTINNGPIINNICINSVLFSITYLS